MDTKEKIIEALVGAFQPEHVRLDDEGRDITGFVVSRQFQGISSLTRQERIDEALERAGLTRDERRQVLMIAAVTPEEYESTGAPIRVQGIRERAGGSVELVVHGGNADAEYVRGIFKNQKGIQTTEPKPVRGAIGVFNSFRATGTQANPLSKDKALRLLRQDRYIEILAGS